MTEAGRDRSELKSPSTSQKRLASSKQTEMSRSGLGSPIERASTLSTSTELGSGSWKISQYERNPPAEDSDEGAAFHLCILIHQACKLDIYQDSPTQPALGMTMCMW